MMLPAPRAIIAGITALTVRNAPVRLIRTTRSHAASSISSTVAAWSLSAAPYISTSRPPKRSTVAATAARHEAVSVTSRFTATARPPPFSISAATAFAPGSSTSAQATLAPTAAKASAVARPMPFAAPTTIAVFLSRLNAGSIIGISLLRRSPAPQCTRVERARSHVSELAFGQGGDDPVQLARERFGHARQRQSALGGGDQPLSP